MLIHLRCQGCHHPEHYYYRMNSNSRWIGFTERTRIVSNFIVLGQNYDHLSFNVILSWVFGDERGRQVLAKLRHLAECNHSWGDWGPCWWWFRFLYDSLMESFACFRSIRQRANLRFELPIQECYRHPFVCVVLPDTWQALALETFWSFWKRWLLQWHCQEISLPLPTSESIRLRIHSFDGCSNSYRWNFFSPLPTQLRCTKYWTACRKCRHIPTRWNRSCPQF